jgi:hypothetical protein
MINYCGKDALLIPVLILEAEKWPIASVMELARAFQATGSLSTEWHDQSRGVSKWSYRSVKELLLNTPRAPTKNFPTHTEPPLSTSLTAILANPQGPFVCEAVPTSCRDVATANTTPPILEGPLKHADGDRTDIPTASLENEAVPLQENATESANATGVAIPSNSASHLINEAEPVLRLSKNLYISPDKRTDCSAQELWTEHIKDRLNAELWHALRKERCLQEFVMAGSRPDSLRASVVITCCGEAAAKRVRKVVKNLKWLRDFDVPCAVVVDAIHLYSQLLQQDRHLTPIIEAQLPPNPTTLCGGRIRKRSPPDSQGPFCTLGGLILVEGFAFGITVEHAFHGEFEDSRLQIIDEDVLEPSADSSYGDDEISGSPFVSFGGESNDDTSENSFQSQYEPAQLLYVDNTDQGHDDSTAHSSEEYREGMVYQRIGKALPSIRRDGLINQYSGDWALIDIDDPSCFFPNKIKLPGQTEPNIIEDMVPEDHQAEGHVEVVLVGGGVSSGWLTSSPTLFKVGDLVMDTRLIIMGDKLGENACGLPEFDYCANAMSLYSLRGFWSLGFTRRQTLRTCHWRKRASAVGLHGANTPDNARNQIGLRNQRRLSPKKIQMNSV